MGYTVKMVADLAGVSVRTLHHYDAVGILSPQERSPAGYRVYSHADLERLQQVLFFRELGFGLREIKAILSDPSFDRRQALRDHRELLCSRRERIERLIGAVDGTLASLEGGSELSEEAMFQGFDNAEYEEEVRRKWGHTAAYKESRERAEAYSQDDWNDIMQQQQTILRDIAGLADRSPDDPDVLDAVRRMHNLINDRFYACPLAMFRGLGDLMVEDPRFTDTFDKLRPGLALFYRQAVHAYCDQVQGQ